MAKIGHVQRKLLAALADDTLAYRRIENHRLTQRSHSITVRWKWEGDWKDQTIRSLVRRGFAAYLTKGGPVVGVGITAAGRAALAE